MPSATYIENKAERRSKLSTEERRTEALEAIADTLCAAHDELQKIRELLQLQLSGRSPSDSSSFGSN